MKINATARISSVIDNLDSYGLTVGDREESGGEYSAYYEYLSDGARLEYSESTDGGEVRSSVTVKGEVVTVERNGAVESRFEFREGVAHESLYGIPPYSFDTVVTAKKIRLELGESGGRIDLIYNMRIGGADKAVRMKIWILSSSDKG